MHHKLILLATIILLLASSAAPAQIDLSQRAYGFVGRMVIEPDFYKVFVEPLASDEWPERLPLSKWTWGAGWQVTKTLPTSPMRVGAGKRTPSIP